MINSLIYYEKYEIFFNYGVSTFKDYYMVNSFIELIDKYFSSMYPNTNKFQLFHEMIDIYEKNRKLRKSRNNKTDAEYLFPALLAL